MKAMFPNQQSAGLGASGRALLIGGAAIAVAAALVVYHGEVRAEARTLLGQLQDVPIIGDYLPHPVVRHKLPVAVHPVKPGAAIAARPAGGSTTAKTTKAGATTPGATKPGATAVPVAKPGTGAPATPNGVVATATSSPAPAPHGAAPATPNSSAVAVQAGRPAAVPGKPVVPSGNLTVAREGAPSSKATASPTGAVASGPAARDPAGAPVMREVYTYDKDARRDPFYSLLLSGELRPSIADLNLVGILYDESGRRPVAIMRDKSTNAQYRVTNGQQLGRMRVAQIRRKMVLFTIEEFGMNRQDSLVLGDTTKARAR